MSIVSSLPYGSGNTLCFTYVAVDSGSWTTSNFNASYPYQATISLTGVTANHLPVVTFSESDIKAYNFLMYAQTGNGTLTIYAKNSPSSTIIILSILCLDS